jgi:glycosyltransferase A (GT-A) superfamily protein (DUF2064 family)
MHSIMNDESGERSTVRDRVSLRFVASLSFADAAAGTRVIELLRTRLAYRGQRVVLTSASHVLPAEVVEHAFDALRYSGLVCAPGRSGEIVLIGMTRLHEGLLAAVPWGTPNALPDLLRAARARGVTVMLFPEPPVTGLSVS